MLSLKDQIKSAKTDAAINALLDQGKSFIWATEKTRRSWTKVARIRKSELNSPPQEKSAETDKVRKPRSDKGKSRKKETVGN